MTDTTTTDASPVDAEQEEFAIGGEAADGMKSKFDFEGNYAVEITELTFGKSSKGNPMFTATLVGQEGPALGLVFKDYQPEFKTAEMLKHLGISKGEDGQLRFKKANVLGKTLVAKFKREFYEAKGTWSAKIQGYGPLGTSTGPANGDDTVPF